MNSKDNVHSGHRKRMKNRFLAEGLLNFEHHEVLEFLLYPFIPYKDTNPIAHDLINTFGSFSSVIDASPQDLLTVKNMTENAAIYLSSLKDFVKIYSIDKKALKKKIINKAEAVEYLKILIGLSSIEEVYLMCLDIHSQLLQTIPIAKGTENKCNLTIKGILEIALRCKAKYIILSHNHPSGNVEPSIKDISLTNQLYYICTLLGIKLIDHIIVSSSNHYSFDDNNMLQMKGGNIVNQILLAEESTDDYWKEK